MKRERIDKILVERGLVESRSKAQALVMSGAVLVDEQRIDKPSELVNPSAALRIKGTNDPAHRYVGRGGVKLEAALHKFYVQVEGSVCLDVGASTGGFTDCLLQNGALRVIALDVGHNQLDWRIRSHPQVEVREGVNARYLSRDDFPGRFDIIVMDVSFISATKIFPAIAPLLGPNGSLIVLIKPQFEVGKGEVGKGGIVRDPEKHQRVISEVKAAAAASGLLMSNVIESPITGADGNIEFLALFVNEADQGTNAA